MQNTVANAHPMPRDQWQTQNGFWGFEYQFVDGSRGSANHKQETPKFAPGQVVTYDIVGERLGLNKIKFHAQQPVQGGAAPQQSYQQPQQSYQAPAQAASAPRQASSDQIHGATVGMALNNAIALINGGVIQFREPITRDNLGITLRVLASEIIQQSAKLESGDLWNPAPTQQAAPQQSYQAPAPAPLPPPQQPKQRYEPGPDGQAYNPNDPSNFEEFVPF